MQDLIELVQILTAGNPNYSIGAKLNLEKGSKLAVLFQGLATGKIETDEDALWQLYQTEEEHSTYRKLKSSLRERLLESLCHQNTNTSDYTDYQKAYFECHKQWVYLKILSGQNANLISITLATKLLKQTIKFDFVHLSMDIASYLRLQFALREPNDKKFQEVNQQFNYFRKVHDAECLAEEMYALHMAKDANGRTKTNELTNNILEFQYEQISSLLQSFDSYRLHLYGRLLGLKYILSKGDFEAGLTACEDAIRFFLAKPYEARGALQIYYYEKISCHIQLRQPNEGRLAANQIQQYLKIGTFNWFKAQELFVKLSMHTQEYSSAADTIFRVIKHPRYQALPEGIKESWQIYEAYLYFLSFLNKVEMPLKHSFKMGKFLNATPILSKDKSGMNVAIKVIEVLVLIAERKYSLLLEQAESLEQYCYRYLKGHSVQRSFLFLKMLLSVPSGQFDRLLVEKKTRKFLEKLDKHPTPRGKNHDEMEIIPYEELWPMVLSLLA